MPLEIAQHRAKRMKDTNEVFTPDPLVCEMLSKLPKEVWEQNKTFCDPAVGNGQFLVWILLKKIQMGHNPTDALKTLYGVDIMWDNVNECRLRLLKITHRISEENVKIVLTNIQCADLEKYPNGSLDYNFDFAPPTQGQVEAFIKLAHKYIPRKSFAGKEYVSVPTMNEIKKLLPLI